MSITITPRESCPRDRVLWPSFIRFLSSLAAAALMAKGSAAEQSDHEITLNLLEGRKRQQVAAAAKFQAFREFQFSDGIAASQIRFEHHIVDDAGVTYKAAHYDHGNGLAVADIDGDGLPDIYFTTQMGVNELWRNIGRGKFEDVTGKAGVGLADQVAVTASFADFDNDGDPDLFVTTVRHGNHLFENLGKGRFADITKGSGLEYSGHSSGAVFFDFDNDGLLDLLVVNVGVYTTNQKGRGGYYTALPDAFSGHLYPDRTEYSLLYRNLGGGKFKEISKEVNLRDGSWSGDAAFADLNGDNFPDLYLVNMEGDNHYYENQAGKGFVDKTAAYFPKTPWGAMGVKFFDYNQDGLIDLFVTDMHSDMSQGQTMQALNFRLDMEKTKSEAFCAVQWTEEYLQGSSNNVFGNAFYQNNGGGKFKEVSDELGVETYWPWGISVGDLNADGYEDVFVTAGMGYPFRYAINSVLLNEDGKRFFDAEFILGVEPRGDRRTEKAWFTLDCDGADKQHPECAGKSGRITVNGTLSSRSSAIFDLDGDGDLDIVTNDLNDRPQILISNLTKKRPVHFLRIKLIGQKSNRDGLGAKVTVTADGKRFMQFHDGKSGYLSQSSLPLYFGLGESIKVEAVDVTWPSGKKQSVTKDIPINRLLEIRE